MPDLTPLFPFAMPFLLVLFRVAGLFSFVPVLSSASIPGNVKVLLSLALTFCIWSVVPHQVAVPMDILSLIVAVFGEFSVGLVIGLMTSLVFTGIQTGAQLISQQMGLTTAAIYDPTFDQQSTVIEQLGFWLALVAFITLGGHREIMAALVASYHAVPMGHAIPADRGLQTLLLGVQEAFFMAVKIAVPGLVSFFLSFVAMGFISRSMPQINLMSISLPLNLMVGLAMIAIGMTSWAVVSVHAWQNLFTRLGQLFLT